MSDVRRWEKERRCVKTKRDNAKVTQKPYHMYFQYQNHYEHWMKVSNEEKAKKKKKKLGMLSYTWNLYNNK